MHAVRPLVLSAIFALVLSGSAFAASTSPSIQGTLSPGKTPTINLKINNFQLYSLFNGLSTTDKAEGTATATLTVSAVVNGKTIVLSSNANFSVAYKVHVNKKTGVATAKAKGFSATSDNSKSQLVTKIDVSATAASLPQTTKGKPKPTLVGVTSVIIQIGSASFTAIVDSKGKISLGS